MKMKFKVFSLALLLCIFTGINSVYSLTREEIRTEIRRKLNDTSTNTAKQRWSDSSLNTKINLAQVDIVARTWCLQSRVLGNTTANTQEYVLPSDLIDIVRVAYSISSSTVNFKKLDYNSMEKLDLKTPNWEATEASQPSSYYTRRNRLGLYPKPSSSYSGNNYLLIDYVEIPYDIPADTCTPFNNWTKLYPYHELIIWSVCASCSLEDKNVSEYTYFRNLYIDGIVNMNRELGFKPDRKITATIP